MARPALGSTPDAVFESDSVAAAVRQVAAGEARPVRRLPARFGLDQLRQVAAADRRQGVGAGGIAWAISELDLQPVYLNFADNAHLMVTGGASAGGRRRWRRSCPKSAGSMRREPAPLRPRRVPRRRSG
ncbi:ESX-5 secretion system eccCb5 domain protein [Mycobacterium xenopi 4042]|uniref:ESX-5 secretion system eccCb5 domain protein n=1 Tax=Mycobacterium xenopi 4042 TaxID=1299334 RepID=X8BF12_MYCXE|nr:ESX-5 secretion system eccCb5 domain protein [Mycobacterium xenopi 4042]